MKGISPFVASVMLIAFTVAAGAVISLWFTSFSQRTTAGVGEQTSAVNKCSGALKITYVAKNITIVEPTTSGLDRLTVTSIVDSEGNILYSNSSGLDVNAIVQVNLTGNVTSDANWVKASGQCTYSNQVVPVEAVCYRGQSCWAVKSS